MSNRGWIGVDLDGTLAHYEGWVDHKHIGAPIPLMVERVKGFIAEGKFVRIFTARVWRPAMFDSIDGLTQWNEAVEAIENWCVEHLGKKLPITCEKDFGMVALFDDRCEQVVPNDGRTIREFYEQKPQE